MIFSYSAGFNLSSILRKLIKFGTARRLQGLRGVVGCVFSALSSQWRAEFTSAADLMKIRTDVGSWLSNPR